MSDADIADWLALLVLWINGCAIGFPAPRFQNWRGWCPSGKGVCMNYLTSSLILFACLSLSSAPIGCSSSDSATPQSAVDSAIANADSNATSDTAVGETADAVDSQSTPDADATSEAGHESYDAGCLTFAGASEVCGTKSDHTICAFSVGCKSSSSDGQCSINCEMGASVGCYSAANVKCLRDAVAAKSCTALKACNWIL
ncbi:MAG: hypothetical protein NVS3B20_03990 [Polyangiales bacterium]